MAVYLDNAATTPIAPEVVDAMIPATLGAERAGVTHATDGMRCHV